MQAMGNIHAILPNGKVVTNVEVFQRLYQQVGLGWVYAFANIGPLKAAAERCAACLHPDPAPVVPQDCLRWAMLWMPAIRMCHALQPAINYCQLATT